MTVESTGSSVLNMNQAGEDAAAAGLHLLLLPERLHPHIQQPSGVTALQAVVAHSRLKVQQERAWSRGSRLGKRGEGVVRRMDAQGKGTQEGCSRPPSVEFAEVGKWNCCTGKTR
eukprot:GGOE01010718.1.p5 GENE.GGOE01010718.1~~GGOE01010718.1.p5  ORF type:complete len:115 (+),score=5.56 GGOE01010718.1:518-862(+)